MISVMIEVEQPQQKHASAYVTKMRAEISGVSFYIAGKRCKVRLCKRKKKMFDAKKYEKKTGNDLQAICKNAEIMIFSLMFNKNRFMRTNEPKK